MSAGNGIAITGYGIEAPRVGEVSDLLALQPMPEARTFDAARKLGRKGLLYKDEATKLALCAVVEALARAGLPRADLHASAPTGVVVSSNLGNVDTICRMIDTMYAASTADLSPMDAPNASSNVIASSIAIRFGCRALNLMVCNGATSGTDAVFVAANALRTHRAERMIVVGVEPQNTYVQQLVAASLPRSSDGPERLQLGEGAACVVLEDTETARRRGATVYGLVGGYAYTAAQNGMRPPLRPDLWFTPNQAWPRMRAMSDKWLDEWRSDPPTCDISGGLGELYGALGVFQCVAACLWLEQPSARASGFTALATAGGSWGDGVANLTIWRAA